MIKGIVPKFSVHSIEPEHVYLSVFFVYLMSKLFSLPFYLDHAYLDRIDENRLHQGLADQWKKIFNTFLYDSRQLVQSDIPLLVNYRDLPKHFGLSTEVMVAMDFEDAYEIFLENYDVYAAKAQMILSGRFKAHSQFEPMRKIFDPKKINITIDITEPSSMIPTSDRGQLIQSDEKNSDSNTVDLNKSETIPNQTPKNQNKDSKAYLHLIKQLTNSIVTLNNKDKEIHIFSTGDRGLFKELLVESSAEYKINLHLNLPIHEKFYFESISDYLIFSNTKLGWLASLVNSNPSFVKYPFQYVLAPTSHYFTDGLTLIKDQFTKDMLAKNIWISPKG